MKNIIILLITIILISGNVFSQTKIWDRDDQIVENVGPVQMIMTKMTNRDAPLNGFQVSTFNRNNSISTVFRGACNPVVTVEVMASDARKLNLEKFSQTRSGNDLPIHEVVDVTQKTISNECDEQIEVMRFTFKVMHHTAEDYNYQGTLTKANRWKIQDGRVETAFDDAHTFELAYRDIFSVAGMRYKGVCEESPVLLLEPQFASNQEAALANAAEMHSWEVVARDVSKMYAKECPKTEEIKYVIKPLPEEYICKVEGEDCFMVARRTSDWEPDLSQFYLDDYVPPITDFVDIVEVLAAGKFEILADYDSFLAFYFESFIGIYSDLCSSHIKDPVPKNIFTIERKFADDGSLISESVDGPPRRINIERKFVPAFEVLFDSWKMWAVGQLISRMASSHHRETNPMLAAQLSMGFMTSNIKQLEKIIGGSCMDERLQAAYANLYNYTNNIKPIIGEFSTGKEKLVKKEKNRSSAPVAIKAIEAKRKAREDEQNVRSQGEHKKRMDDFKRRKEEGIAVHSGSKARQQNVNQDEQINHHQANQNKLRELGMKYQKEMAAANEKFSLDMQNAKTNEERHSIQKAYQQASQQRNVEMQKAITNQHAQ